MSGQRIASKVFDKCAGELYGAASTSVRRLNTNVRAEGTDYVATSEFPAAQKKAAVAVSDLRALLTGHAPAGPVRDAYVAVLDNLVAKVQGANETFAVKHVSMPSQQPPSLQSMRTSHTTQQQRLADMLAEAASAAA